MGVVDAEAEVGGGGCEAGMVLVEGEFGGVRTEGKFWHGDWGNIMERKSKVD